MMRRTMTFLSIFALTFIANKFPTFPMNETQTDDINYLFKFLDYPKSLIY